MKPEEAIDRLNIMLADESTWNGYTKDGKKSFQQALETAKNALKKQMPKKLILKTDNWTDAPRCSRCNRLIKGGYKHLYCHACGQQYEEEVEE